MADDLRVSNDAPWLRIYNDGVEYSNCVNRGYWNHIIPLCKFLRYDEELPIPCDSSNREIVITYTDSNRVSSVLVNASRGICESISLDGDSEQRQDAKGNWYVGTLKNGEKLASNYVHTIVYTLNDGVDVIPSHFFSTWNNVNDITISNCDLGYENNSFTFCGGYSGSSSKLSIIYSKNEMAIKWDCK